MSKFQIPDFINLNKGESQYIAIEGPDGAGKSTYLNELHQEVLKHRDDVVLISEPGTTPFANKIRLVLKDPDVKRSILGELFAILSARADLIVNVVLPALKEGKLILSDRCFVSTLVYQSLRYGDVFNQFITNVNETFFYMVSTEQQCDVDSIYPNHVILLNPPVDVVVQRLNKRDGGIIKDGLYDANMETIKNFHGMYKALQYQNIGDLDITIHSDIIDYTAS